MTRLRVADRLAPGWLVVQVLGTAVLIATIATAQPVPAWLFSVYMASLACWLLWLATDSWLPRTSLVLLTIASVLPALVLGPGMDDSTALIMLCVVLGRFAMLPRPSTKVITAVAVLDVVVAVGSCLAFDRPASLALGAAAACVMVTLLGLHPRQYQLQVTHTHELLEQTRLAQREQARAAALDERTRIARELHDVLAHSLGALGVQLEVAEALLTEKGDTAGAVDRIRRSRRLAAEGLVEARRAVAALRSDVRPLAEAVADLAEQHRHNHGVVLEMTVVGTPRRISSAATVSLLGTVREALTNAAKHAPGAPLAIVLSYRVAVVQVEVRNDPSGRAIVADEEPGGYGLTGMRERVALVGGTLTTKPEGHGGWLVSVEVPE